jgi:hypothetical protein
MQTGNSKKWCYSRRRSRLCSSNCCTKRFSALAVRYRDRASNLLSLTALDPSECADQCWRLRASGNDRLAWLALDTLFACVFLLHIAERWPDSQVGCHSSAILIRSLTDGRVGPSRPGINALLHCATETSMKVTSSVLATPSQRELFPDAIRPVRLLRHVNVRPCTRRMAVQWYVGLAGPFAAKARASGHNAHASWAWHGPEPSDV